MTLEREAASLARLETSRIRDSTADRRDREAETRDAAADARDELSDALDAQLDRLEREEPGTGGEPASGLEALRRAAAARRRATASRTRAAAARREAAQDRALARADRVQAAADRRDSARELAGEGTDHLTGALRRRIGLAAIERELDRVCRTGDSLVLAFVDVDGLKAVNDTAGHAAGDALLSAVVATIQRDLRTYDVVMRYGGDEFVCSLSGQDMRGAVQRFGQISGRLASERAGASITVGLAEYAGDDESAAALIMRADAAMMGRTDAGLSLSHARGTTPRATARTSARRPARTAR